ncbi:MAG: LapA family protein [Desulfurivibrionaceae bacterium]|nr:LapA family protein [Desulfurivibrionaceae bacterium]
MKNPKLLAALALAGLVIIFLYQNAATVEIRFLFWEAAMSLSLLIFLVLAIGILTGWLLHSYLYHHTGRGKGGEPERGTTPERPAR